MSSWHNKSWHPKPITVQHLPTTPLWLSLMIMIRCHLSDFVEFIKDDLRRSSDSPPERKLIENAAQKYYDHAVSELMMPHKFQYYAKYSRSLTILDQDIRLTIKRVYRKDCHADAVLLSFMVPYSNRTVNNFLAILAEDHQRQSDRSRSEYHYGLFFPAWPAVPAEQETAQPARFHMTIFSHSWNIKVISRFLC